MYEVTGVLTNGRRFKVIKTENLRHALSINLYRGTVWERDEQTGKRRRIKSVYN